MDNSLDIDLNPVFATTHVVRQTVLTVESLHSAAACVNERDRKPVMFAEHDHLCPPMGQTVACKVVPLKDGHHALIGEYDIFPPPTEIDLPSGEIGYQQQSAKHPHPLTIGKFHHPDNYCIGIDPTNVGGAQELENLFAQLKQSDNDSFQTQPIERRSAIPDPEIIFTLGLKASAAWFGLRIAKAAADAIESELKNFFQVLIQAVKNMAANAIPKNRPITYILQVHGKPNLEFVARTRDADAVISAMADRDMSDLRPKIDSLLKRFKAEMVQFKLRDDGTWAFNYLATRDGKVIGSREAFDHRAVVLKDMALQRKRKKNA